MKFSDAFTMLSSSRRLVSSVVGDSRFGLKVYQIFRKVMLKISDD